MYQCFGHNKSWTLLYQIFRTLNCFIFSSRQNISSKYGALFSGHRCRDVKGGDGGEPWNDCQIWIKGNHVVLF